MRENLKLLNSDLDPARVYSQFGQVLADYFYLGSRPISAARDLVDERLGFEHLREAHGLGRGALLLTPHLSFFELGSVVMQEFGFPLLALTNPEPSPDLARWRADYRARWGVETLELGEDPFQFVQMARRLREGKFVAALFDRPHSSQSVPVPMPGGTLAASSGILMLALLAGCPVIPVTVVAKANGRYRLEAFPFFLVDRRGSPAETLQHYTQLLMDRLLPTLCSHAEQWFQFVPLKDPAIVPPAPALSSLPGKPHEKR